MFSMLLATASAVVPSTQPTLLRLPAIYQPRGDVEASLKRDSALDGLVNLFEVQWE